jgi:hypothetical protein
VNALAMADLQLTEHSRARLQQRAIPPLVTTDAIRVGVARQWRGAADVRQAGHQAAASSPGRQSWTEGRGAVAQRYTVVGDNGSVVTAAHKSERFRRSSWHSTDRKPYEIKKHRWQLRPNPAYWGSSTPEVLVLGFSKGSEQNRLIARHLASPRSGVRFEDILALCSVPAGGLCGSSAPGLSGSNLGALRLVGCKHVSTFHHGFALADKFTKSSY